MAINCSREPIAIERIHALRTIYIILLWMMIYILRQRNRTIQNTAGCQNVTEHKQRVKQRSSKQFKHKDHTTVTIKIMTALCSYVLREGERLLIMQRQYKMCKLAGCVKVKRKFRLQHDIGTSSWINSAGLNREDLMTGESQIYNVQLSANKSLDNYTVTVCKDVF